MMGHSYKAKQWLGTAAIVAVSAHFAIVLQWTSRPFLDLSEYAAGHAALPYQARILMAWVLRYLAPLPFITALVQHAPHPLHDPFVMVQTLCAWLAMTAATLATRASILRLTQDAEYARAACFLLPLMADFNLVLPYGSHYAMPPDVPSLAFFCSGVLLIMKRRWILFYPLFLFATLNRETSLFLIVITAAWLWAEMDTARSQRFARILPHVASQLALWVGTKLWLFHHFAGNPTEHNGNGIYATSIGSNLHSIVNPGQWPLFLSLFAFLPIPLWLGRRYIDNRALSLATAATVPLWIVAMFLVGVIVEVRIFNELAALLALVAALEAYHRWFTPNPSETA